MYARTLLSIILLASMFATPLAAKPPQALDERLSCELFAEHPQIMTPTGIAVDAQGRVFVAESHTHFRPEAYDGPAADRILVFTDTDGDGKADRRRIFHQGFTHLMDIEFHPDGSLYAATRMDIHRLRDTNGDGKADDQDVIVRMKTTGTYPHNGLSGLAFDQQGNLHFGLGENLGHDYTLIGSDGVELAGGGEGGTTYHVRADGSKLRRTSTGWWNPWGMCVDRHGRVFGTDNDPGASPPCRLIQVIEGADYGYEYRYGRTGLHPLVSWTGEIPGTLPMISGTGEAPCAIICYESSMLPANYRGDLFVASWADHRIERYPLLENPGRGLVSTKRHVLVEGADDFRPVGLALAPDGSVFVSDWVSSSYALHKQGRIWRISSKQSANFQQPEPSLRSIHLPDRQQVARQRQDTKPGREELRRLLQHSDPGVRSTALQALVEVNDAEADYESVARSDPSVVQRVTALTHLLDHGAKPHEWLSDAHPAAIRAAAVRRLPADAESALALLEVCGSGDPLLVHAATECLTRHAADAEWLELIGVKYPALTLLARRRNPAVHEGAIAEQLAAELHSPVEDAQYLAIKWVADDRLTQFRPQLKAMLADPKLAFRSFLAIAAALDHLDGKKPLDQPADALLVQTVRRAEGSPAVLRWALRLVSPQAKGLTSDLLYRVYKRADLRTRVEAVRTLGQRADPRNADILTQIANDLDATPGVRAEAVASLTPGDDASQRATLIRLLDDRHQAVRDEVLRTLVGAPLSDEERKTLRQWMLKHPESVDAVRRLMEGKPEAERPESTDVDGWLKLIGDRKGDPVSGERIFFGRTVATCAKCHQMQGRGHAVGPSLSLMHRRLEEQGTGAKRWLLQTLLEPSRDMAPQYTPWQIVTTDGRTLVGLPRRKGGNQEAYLGVDGKEFSVRKDQIELHRETNVSLMPADLLNQLTRQELADLLAFMMKN